MCGAIVLEIVSFHLFGLGFMPEYWVYDLTIMVFLGLIIFAIPNYKAEYIVATIMLLVQTILIYANYSLYNIFGDYFSFDMFSLAAEAGAAVTSNFVFFVIILQLIATFTCVAIIGSLALKVCSRNNINVKQHYSILCVLVFVSLQFFSVGNFIQIRQTVNASASINKDEYFSSDAFLMNGIYLKQNSYSKFGSFGYFTNMLINTFNRGDKALEDATLHYFNNGTTYSSSDVFGIDEGNNVVVFMMETTEWFGFGDGTYDPTVNNLSYELTPNIYSLIYGQDYLTDTSNSNRNNDSLIATNFFSKAKTNMSESNGIMGNFPVGKSLKNVVKLNEDNLDAVFGYSMPKILQQKGYKTTYVHSHKLSFYNRDDTHARLGFDNVIGKDTLVDAYGNKLYTGNDLKFDNWAAEGDFAKHAMKYIVPNTTSPFYTFYLNVSSHGAFTEEDNHYDGDAKRYFNYVKYGPDDCVKDINGNWIVNPTKTKDELTYTNWYTNILNRFSETDPSMCLEMTYYQCGMMGLDEAIGNIVTELNNRGIADETTMLLFSDHYAYYGQLANRFKGFDNKDFSSIELNTVPMILSSPGLKAKNATLSNKYIVNSRFTSAYDIVPTLLDLLGIEFNENFYLGQSLFKPADYVYAVDNETGEMEVIDTSTVTPDQLEGKQIRDMLLYYSNTGGIFSQDIYAYSLGNAIYENENVTPEVEALFNSQLTNTLKKVNYINILNNYALFSRVSNK